MFFSTKLQQAVVTNVAKIARRAHLPLRTTMWKVLNWRFPFNLEMNVVQECCQASSIPNWEICLAPIVLCFFLKVFSICVLIVCLGSSWLTVSPVCGWWTVHGQCQLCSVIDAASRNFLKSLILEMLDISRTEKKRSPLQECCLNWTVCIQVCYHLRDCVFHMFPDWAIVISACFCQVKSQPCM